ncbi:MAG: metallophosphoesterase [Lachnospiraceae bacterium]|nr:metallophosphoesterase [Lachnospiraceae bacterium]
MRILMVSDTHGKLDNFMKAVDKTAPVDMIIHCGDVEGDEERIRAYVDCPVVMVRGNNDFFSDLPWEETVEAAGLKIFVTHGPHYNVSMGPERLIDEAKDRKVDIALFGHTHKPAVHYDDGLYLVNPGSLSYPRQDGRRPSYVVMSTDNAGNPLFTINYL